MSNSAWKSLKQCPLGGWATSPCTSPLILNDNELLFVPWTNKGNYLLKYNIAENTWINWIKYPKELKSKYHSAALNTSKTILYMYGDSGHVIEVDLIRQKFKQSEWQGHNGSYCGSLVINENFHVFGGWESEYNSHFIWDATTQELDCIHEFDEIHLVLSRGSEDGLPEALYNVSVKYIASKNAVLIIPGHATTGIFMYYLDSNECKCIMRLQGEKGAADCVITADERFVIIFCPNIQIIDLDRRCIHATDIKCPGSGTIPKSKAVIRNDKYLQNVITFGFVRKCWKFPSFKGMKFLPVYLIKMIQGYYYHEDVHLLLEEGSHWTMCVDHIIWSLDLQMKKKHLNDWNSTDIIHWLETVDEGKLKRRFDQVRILTQHIRIGNVKGNELSLFSDFTLRIIGISSKYTRLVVLKYIQQLLNQYK